MKCSTVGMSILRNENRNYLEFIFGISFGISVNFWNVLDFFRILISGFPKYFITHALVVQVRDMHTGRSYDFLCNNWLDVTEGDGLITTTLPVTSTDELNDFDFVFRKLLYQQMYDGHIWLSLFTR